MKYTQYIVDRCFMQNNYMTMKLSIRMSICSYLDNQYRYAQFTMFLMSRNVLVVYVENILDSNFRRKVL